MITLNRLLIANRGEIAVRIARSARRLGIATIAVCSDADRASPHVTACDEHVPIGGLLPSESYLVIDKILAAARATGAQAIHPGYGFLSENAAFAAAVEAAGLVFVGPPASAIEAMGDKARARQRMAAAGIPVVPGYDGDDQDEAQLLAAAARIGFPIMVKAAAGGGGRGMRRVETAAELLAALRSAASEAAKAFGDGRLILERAVVEPRHVEIQVFADAHGHVLHLGERDCSVQRRHQKIVEEAPSPAVDPVLRERMGAAATAVAREIGYVGAGTVEFLLDPDGHFYFMEMNTRLQVEHPVTEAITGLDLVEWQLRVADGEPLPLAQEQLTMRGHAIEARICAENPEGGFLPATGTLQVARWPAHVAFRRNADAQALHDPAAVRIDRGFDEGDTVSPYYDSMIAKLIVWGEDRAMALARLDAALRDTHLMGLHNNVAFLRRVAASHAFATADLDTALIEREHAALFEAPPLAAEVAAAAVVAHRLATEARLEDADPWSRRDGWRLHGGAQRRLSLQVQGRDLTVLMERLHDGATVLQIGDQRWPFAARGLGGARHDLQLGGQRMTATVYAQGERHAVFTDAGSALVNEFDPIAHAGEGATEGRLTAPMPGKVVSFFAQPGDRVQRGQALAVMEAMKMEHTLHAPHDGVVAELLYAVGDQVLEGGELLRLAPS